MFLGPFGLLPYAPMPESMRLFVPAYGATRMIAEVCPSALPPLGWHAARRMLTQVPSPSPSPISPHACYMRATCVQVLVEALPQWVMQAIIFVLVSSHVRDGTASEVDMTMYKFQNGSFVSVMPKSILISSLTMLKTWYDLVQEAREAGISVAKKGVQLWNVGHGLPLDAIKSGSITGWKCQCVRLRMQHVTRRAQLRGACMHMNRYEISDEELVSLVDALGKNDSLERLDLSLAGFEWLPPVKREERSAISTLLQVMNADSGALESCETLVISQTTNWPLPVGKLRSGPEAAIKALNEVPFLSKGGPEREEMHAMFELLCKNRNPDPSEAELDLSFTPVEAIFTDSARSGGNKKAKRAAWQSSLAKLISKGMARRAHFKILIGPEVLRNVGFGARELLDLGFSAAELKVRSACASTAPRTSSACWAHAPPGSQISPIPSDSTRRRPCQCCAGSLDGACVPCPRSP